MKRRKQWRSIWVPPRVYAEREQLSNRVAACVLIAPELCPDHKRLPRHLVSDQLLREVLNLARQSFGRWKVMARKVHKRLEVSDVANLLAYVEAAPDSRLWTSIGQCGWYVERLRRLEQGLKDHEKALKKMADTADMLRSEW